MKRSILVLLLAAGVWVGCEAPAPEQTVPVTPENRVPDWAADAIFYQIFPERFRNGDPTNDPTRESLETPIVPSEAWEISPWTGDWYARADWEQELGDDFYEDGVFHRRYGGDLQGVIDKLDYLKELGINAIYFNPVFYARSLHKYDGNTYHHIDPYFGPDPEGDFALMAEETSDPDTWHFTAADRLFLQLIEEAHNRGIRVIIDGVWNHTGRDFFAFDDIRKNQAESPYRDWYIVEQFDDPYTPENEFRYKGWWGVESLPEFADTEDGTDLHPGPKEYIFDATARWMDPNGDGDPSDGIDGWRLDVANEVPIRFWADWNAHVRSLNPQAYTVTEIWENAASFIENGGFSATMNYYGFAFPVKGFLIDNAIPPSRFVELIEEFEKVSAKDVHYLDLKTASNIPYPYICHSRNTHCKAFAAHFPFYQVMGLDAFINDHLGFYLHAKNYTCSTLKVGTHADYSVEQIHEATIWWALVRLGCLQEADVPEFPVHRQILNSCRSEEGKRTFEVIYKYTIQEDEFFRMIPGFQNFQKITIGEPLATSDGASVVSQWEGRIFMPLYHTRSNDGFFVLKEID